MIRAKNLSPQNTTASNFSAGQCFDVSAAEQKIRNNCWPHHTGYGTAHDLLPHAEPFHPLLVSCTGFWASPRFRDSSQCVCLWSNVIFSIWGLFGWMLFRYELCEGLRDWYLTARWSLFPRVHGYHWLHGFLNSNLWWWLDHRIYTVNELVSVPWIQLLRSWIVLPIWNSCCDCVVSKAVYQLSYSFSSIIATWSAVILLPRIGTK